MLGGVGFICIVAIVACLVINKRRRVGKARRPRSLVKTPGTTNFVPNPVYDASAFSYSRPQSLALDESGLMSFQNVSVDSSAEKKGDVDA